jgi:hypothetical protein
MNNRLRIGIVLLAGAVAVLLLLVLTARPEPSFDGKPISGWLAELRPFGGQLTAKDKNSLRAIKMMGPPAEAYLVDELRARETLLERTYRSAWLKLPGQLQVRLPNPLKPSRRERAAWALARLWPESRDTIQALVETLKDSNQSVRICSAEALGKISESSRDVESALLQACFNDLDPIVRANAASSLRFLGTEGLPADRVPPVATNVPPSVPGMLLGRVPPGARNPMILVTSPSGWGVTSADFEWKSVSQLIKDLNRSQPEVRYQAARFLAEAGPQATPAVPALVFTLQNPAEYVRAAAVRALGNIGPAAAPAIPAIQASLNRETSDIYRRIVTEAERKISPQPAAGVYVD